MPESTAPVLERPAGPSPSLVKVLTDIGPGYAVNGLVGFIFAATGPVAIVLASGSQGGLGQAELASWLFGAFFLNGLVTIALSWRFRTPLVIFWTIPGTVLVGQALLHTPHAEVIGAFVATGLFVTVLGLSGWMRRAQALLPMPIVMAMVAGVFLRFGLDLVRAVHHDPAVAGPMVVAFVLLSALPRLARWLPPIIGALLIGAVAVAVTHPIDWSAASSLSIVAPRIVLPVFSWRACLELVVPLAVTVLVVQNAQGYAVLKSSGHDAPVNWVTLACGLTSIVSAFVGTVSSCLTGPTNALVSSSGSPGRHYTGAIVVGILALAFGLFAGTATSLLLAAPKAYIGALAGLAMLKVLQTAFASAFRDRFALGTLVTFLVTVADLPILNIGAPFWGLVLGLVVAWLLERPDFSIRQGPSAN